MICEPCKNGYHRTCTNYSTCPCQHRIAKLMEDGTVAPLSPRDELRKESDAAE